MKLTEAEAREKVANEARLGVRMEARASGKGDAYFGLARMTKAGPRWTGKVQFVGDHLMDPIRWKRPRRVFVNSMSDLFHEGVSDEQIDRIFAAMALAPRHQFQVLTKRPERMLRYLTGPWPGDGVGARIAQATWEMAPKRLPEGASFVESPVGPILSNGRPEFGYRRFIQPWPLPNVWLGVSAEDQATADERIPLLLQTPAAVRWVSAEPLLGPMDLRKYMLGGNLSLCGNCGHHSKEQEWLNDPEGGSAHCPRCDSNSCELDPEWDESVDWVVVGGESGAGARPMLSEWARSLRDQCAAAGVAYFFKQWGEWVDASHELWGRLPTRELMNCDSTGKLLDPPPADENADCMTLKRVGKKAAGDLLDRVQHHHYPVGGPADAE
jgi:protein gp37